MLRQTIKRLTMVAVVATCAAAGFAPGATADTYHFRLVDYAEATANWLSTDATGCVQTRPFLWAHDDGGASASGSFVFGLWSIDTCGADPYTPIESFWGNGTLASGDFTVDRALRGATFAKTFTAVDSVTNESREFSVRVQWSSTSAIHTGSTHINNLCFEVLDVENGESQWRDAQATGSVSSGQAAVVLDAGRGYISAGTFTAVDIYPLPTDICAPNPF